jgi:hypothetical protein
MGKQTGPGTIRVSREHHVDRQLTHRQKGTRSRILLDPVPFVALLQSPRVSPQALAAFLQHLHLLGIAFTQPLQRGNVFGKRLLGEIVKAVRGLSRSPSTGDRKIVSGVRLCIRLKA